MKLLRSWPAVVPEGRAYVIDDLERLYMTDHDYAVLDRVDDDVIIIEWDMAVHRDELRTFVQRAAASPEVPLVAPYLLYEMQSGIPHHRPCWAHRRFQEGGQTCRFIIPTDATAHLFGFGLVYLPRLLVTRFLADWNGHFSDASFSQWHYLHSGRPEVPIAWDVRPVHLHYNIVKIAEGLT